MQISFPPNISSIYILYKANFSWQRRDLTSVVTHTRMSLSSVNHPASLFYPPCNQPSLKFIRTSKRKEKKFFGPSNTAAILDVSLFQGHWT